MKHRWFLFVFIWVLATSMLVGEPELITLGPYGGDVRSLASHPLRPDWIFLGTADGQLFLSKNGGNRWEKMTPGLNRRELVLDSIVFHPNSAEVLYVGGWELRSDRGELFLSQNSGSSWKKVDLGRYQSSIRAVALSSTNPQHIAVGITEGVVVSRDGGEKWNRISRGYRSLYNVHSLVFHPTDEELLFAGTWRLGWRTPDLGKSWKRIQKGIYWDSHLFSIQINPENPDVVFAGACSGIYRSLNGGDQWAKLKNGLPSRAKRTRSMLIDPNNPRTVYAGTTAGLYRSVNNGARWKRLIGDVVVNTILVDPRNSNILTIGTDDAGVLKSTDNGETFVPMNEGFIQRQVGTVAVHPDSNNVFYAAVNLDRHFGGFFHSSDRGSTWTAYNDGLGKASASIGSILPLASSKEVFVATGQGLFRGIPGKKEWALVDGTSQLSVRDLDFDRKENLLFLACPDGIRSLDLSKGQLRKHKMPSENAEVTSVLVNGDRKTIYAGTLDGILRSSDNGSSWQAVSKGLAGGSVRTLEQSGPRLLCGTKNGLFLSDDHGNSWSPAEGSFPIEIISIKSNPSRPNEVVAANMLSGYLLTSGNGGRDWETLDLGAALSKISSFAFTPAGDLIAGTATEGVIQIVTRTSRGQSSRQQTAE